MEETLEELGIDLESLGIKSLDDLNSDEQATLDKWIINLKKDDLTVDNVKDYVSAIRASIENELIEEPEFNYIFIFKVPNRKQIYLKARLKNIMLLEAFLTAPEKAKKALENALKRVAR